MRYSINFMVSAKIYKNYEYFKGHQVGVGTPNGLDGVAHALQQVLETYVLHS